MDLKEYLKNNNLLLPNYNNLNIVDLVKFIYSNYGIEFDNDNIKKFKRMITLKKHTVFILIDGMGSNLVNLLDDTSILKSNKVADIQTVSPSSTGCVLTSIATASFPSEHGIMGWYNYDKDCNISYYPLLFCGRKNKKNLKEYNINVKNIFRKESYFNSLNTKTTVLFPKNIYDSDYSNYIANNDIRKSYVDLNDAFDKIKRILESKEESFTYLYISDIDELEHDYGYDSNVVKEKINKIENQLRKICLEDTTIIITADHGQTNVKEDIIMDFNEYDKFFYEYPTIDFGMASYFIKDGMEDQFIMEFNKDFKNKMYLFSKKEFINNKIFGPTTSTLLENNLGEYISLCNSNAQFINSLEIKEYVGKTKGNHSGLTNDEMIIPLIVI